LAAERGIALWDDLSSLHDDIGQHYEVCCLEPGEALSVRRLDYGLDDRGIMALFLTAEEISPSAQNPDWLLKPPSLLSVGGVGLFPEA
jgi:hypothetical protein